LKTEVADAWQSYKTSLEKSAARENELLDEIKAMSKAKQIDKQQYTAHMSTLENTINEMKTQVSSCTAERDAAVAESTRQRLEYDKFKEQEQRLLDSLEEAKANASQNVHTLREDLRAANSIIEVCSNSICIVSESYVECLVTTVRAKWVTQTKPCESKHAGAVECVVSQGSECQAKRNQQDSTAAIGSR
jgi:regulator of replication initiation timing